MKIYKIGIEEGGVWAAWKDEEDVRAELDVHMENAEKGDKLIVEIDEMSEEEYANLPEFQGF